MKNQFEIFETKKEALFDTWISLQNIQAEVTLPLELIHYYNLESWHNAHNVIDLGTGNGYYLSKIANIFPNKQYLGIDISEEFINWANIHINYKNIIFKKENIMNVNSSYDFAILRAVLQHITDHQQLVKSINNLLIPGGVIYIADRYDDNPVYFWPSSPLMEDFYYQIIETQKVDKNNQKDTMESFLSEIEKNTDLIISCNQELCIPTTVNNNHNLFFKQFNLVLELIEKSKTMDIDGDAIRYEWGKWKNHTNSFGQVMMKIIILNKPL